MTERLYERDPYCREFEAVVLSCEAHDGGFRVVLDRTAFFPEGGGQAADVGTLGGAAVLDVQLEDEQIVHVTDAPLAAGSTVAGGIDWELRFSRMQSHAGEHVLSGVVHAMFGYDNVGFHMSETVMTVDFSGPLTAQDIEQVELRANRAVYDNLPITASCPTAEELRTIPYRSKIEPREGIRLITIEGVDCCACCAPHPARTGEIGLIKVIGFIPYKKGTRVEMLAGVHAFRDYCALNGANKYLMGTLSAARDKVAEAVDRQAETIAALRAENQTMRKRLALSELAPVAVGDAAYAFCDGCSYDELRHCANHLIESGMTNCVLFSQVDEQSFLYVVSGVPERVTAIVRGLNAALAGKGGGRDGFAQGRVCASSQDVIRPVAEQLLQAAE